jgi:hypothetical protein
MDRGAADARAAGDTGDEFFNLVEKYRDTGTLFARIGDILECPWIAADIAISRLHDAFSLYQGSRTCLREYLKQTIDDAEIESTVGRLVEKATETQNALLEMAQDNPAWGYRRIHGAWAMRAVATVQSVAELR